MGHNAKNKRDHSLNWVKMLKRNVSWIQNEFHILNKGTFLGMNRGRCRREQAIYTSF